MTLHAEQQLQSRRDALPCLRSSISLKFAPRMRKKLFANNQVLFLEYRCKALHGAPDILPTVVRKTAQVFMGMNRTTSDSARSNLIHDISATVIGKCPTSATLLVAPFPSMRRKFAVDNDIQHAFLIAIAQQNAKAISELLEQGATL